jgi:hypothetical protein
MLECLRTKYLGICLDVRSAKTKRLVEITYLGACK